MIVVEMVEMVEMISITLREVSGSLLVPAYDVCVCGDSSIGVAGTISTISTISTTGGSAAHD